MKEWNKETEEGWINETHPRDYNINIILYVNIINILNLILIIHFKIRIVNIN